MKWFDWWIKTEMDENLQGLELNLQNTLTPVEPRPEFVAGLRQNLLKQVFEIDLTPEPQNQTLQTGILITGGVVGTIVMVLTGVRGVVSVIGIVGLLISIIKQNSQEAPTPSNFAH